MIEKVKKTIKVGVNNSRVMDSIESAKIQVTSPTGRSIWLYKKRLSNVAPEMKTVFWKVCGNPDVQFIGDVEVTIEEMELLLKFSKLY